MIVKKFTGNTETEAIMAAKEELGSNAVVLNMKTIKQRGIFRLFRKDKVEITAALEEKEFVKNVENDSAKAQSVVTEREKGAIEEKLDSLHDLLKNQIEKEVKPPVVEEDDSLVKAAQTVKEENSDSANFKFLRLIYNKLIDNEVEEKCANVIIGEVESSLKKELNIDSLLAGVYQKIILKLGAPKTIKLEDKPKVVFFIGPTGVGKTTTIAKLASKFKLEDKKKVAFITADTYRIAAVEQLNTYAAIIDSPVSVVYESSEMKQYLEGYKNYDLIMVDTAGRSHKSEEQMLELKDLINQVKELSDDFDVDIYLTLSITTKYKDLINITKAYEDIKDYSIIFTKLDETCALGNILNMKIITGAPLSYTTSGQNVPNDIEVINEQALAKLLLGGE